MTGLEIGILIIGASILIFSFFIQEKLTPSDFEEIKKLSAGQVREMINDEVTKAETKLDDIVDQRIETSFHNYDVQTDKDINEKIRQISEYSDSVLDSMNKSHDEIMFMYDMLNDKQSKVTELTKELQNLESVQRALLEEIEKKKNELQEMDVEIPAPEKALSEDRKTDTQEVTDPSPKKTLEEEFQEKVSEQPVSEGGNQEILNLRKKGYSEVEIAKKLGRGLGEVKLVLGLFDRKQGS